MARSGERRDRETGRAGTFDKLIAVAAALVGAVSLLRAFGRPWLLELSTHFQLQYLLAAVAAMLVLVLRRRWRLSLVGVAAVVATSTAVVPVLWRGAGGGAAYAASAAAEGHLRIMHVNVLAPNRQVGAVRAAIEDAAPDVVVVHEATRRWLRGLEPIEALYPHRVNGDEAGNVGIIVYSRRPFDRVTVHGDGDLAWPTIELGLRIDGRPLTLLTSHPKPPLERAHFESRNRQLQALTALAAGLRRPLVVVGDLNTTMWSPWYGDLCEANGLANARRGFGILPSWPAPLPAAMRLPIDHCLVSPGIRVRACWLGPEVGSDHLPLLTDLVVPDFAPVALEQ